MKLKIHKKSQQKQKLALCLKNNNNNRHTSGKIDLEKKDINYVRSGKGHKSTTAEIRNHYKTNYEEDLLNKRKKNEHFLNK